MRKNRFIFLLCILFSLTVVGQDVASYTVKEEIYGRKEGVALTMQVFRPKKSNGAAVVRLISGSWYSSMENWERYKPNASLYLDKGYTYFLVAHGSNPRYNIQEAAADVKRAVQFIRYHANDYGIDPNKIGITGSSAGGHLSLVNALSDDVIDTAAKDPVAKVSGRANVVAVFYPPTDFMNWGGKGISPVNYPNFLEANGVAGAFAFRYYDTTKKNYVLITDLKERIKIAESLSPANLVTKDDPPVFIWHGDADKTVPIQQSKWLEEKYRANNLPFELRIKPGEDHGWKTQIKEEADFVIWFDKYLKPLAAKAAR
ncbi:MAG: alpha/beta hydrolase [Chitinophagaceae bacterium]|nr:alpha/beta hydrolase [Chitinophagaceae bacterium]